ncbi:ThiF family adenylyltransferase [Cellulomonas shaoxiangyii]|uniref:Adenylyltransferase/sulfurtransferase MoeZ n=1 Tax=Cellulomonas shaoxiangyii TaxID=2566013 RepID=A0A4P7SHP3_9CELL|nr:ThiF family adenylyltransferase [Cellulomonas shaoxiangyii]QCB93739.1 adenylyltransferase/sulfurtransferase MoeZ [Cellulomonas shaoxiangyii]TGY78661.1 adenylyltransferase/sulfurtransferase MoeZ [Cellulomonas shaoxiangyii]
MTSPLAPLVAPGPPLTPGQVDRYARHLALAQVGEVGQRRLLAARVLVLGAGGLGSPALLYLAAAGVGTIGVVDDDVVEASNLQRQVVHDLAAVGRPKVVSAAERLRGLNPDVEVRTHALRLTAHNADELLRGYDLVVDGTDNFATRYLVNDTCARLGLPWVWGSVLRGHAQVSVFWAAAPGGGVDLRDVFGEPPAPGTVPSCAEDGVLGAVCAAAGAAMAVEAVKLVCGTGRTLLGRVAVLDAFDATWREVPVRPQPARRTPPPPEGSVDVVTDPRPDSARTDSARTDTPGTPAGELTPAGLRDLLAARDAGAADVDVVDVREPGETAAGTLPGARLVPLGAWADGSALTGLDPDRTLVLVCRSGMRSGRAAAYARAAGVRDVRNLDGGLVAWAREVDPGLVVP